MLMWLLHQPYTNRNRGFEFEIRPFKLKIIPFINQIFIIIFLIFLRFYEKYKSTYVSMLDIHLNTSIYVPISKSVSVSKSIYFQSIHVSYSIHIHDTYF